MPSTGYRTEGTMGRGTRAQRGIALFRERAEEIAYHPTTGTYGVPGTDGTHEVDLAAESCTCADHRYRGATCAHIVASECFVAAARIARKAGRRDALLDRYENELMEHDERQELRDRLIRRGVA